MTQFYTPFVPGSTMDVCMGREIGRGSFSKVFKAEDSQSGCIVAVKQLVLLTLSPPMRGIARQSFRREAALLAQLRHPRIPEFYGSSFDDQGPWFIVMEYIRGMTLEQHLAWYHNDITLQHVIQIGLQLSEVLTYLHTCQPPVIFRDLKPSNILLQASGSVTLIDFGQAWPAEYESENLGTDGYAAPEQYPVDIDAPGRACLASDVYSLGVLLHRLISGEPPKIRKEVGWGEFSSLYGRTDPRLARLVCRMLQREPVERPLIQEVRQALADLS